MELLKIVLLFLVVLVNARLGDIDYRMMHDHQYDFREEDYHSTSNEHTALRYSDNNNNNRELQGPYRPCRWEAKCVNCPIGKIPKTNVTAYGCKMYNPTGACTEICANFLAQLFLRDAYCGVCPTPTSP